MMEIRIVQHNIMDNTRNFISSSIDLLVSSSFASSLCKTQQTSKLPTISPCKQLIAKEKREREKKRKNRKKAHKKAEHFCCNSQVTYSQHTNCFATVCIAGVKTLLEVTLLEIIIIIMVIFRCLSLKALSALQDDERGKFAQMFLSDST